MLKQALKKFYSNFRFSLSANNSILFIGFYKLLYQPKAGSISAIIDQFSKSIGKGFTVIQVGANDGINNDPIHKFIKRDKWNGVLLEPQREVFEKYLSRIYKKDKGIITLNAAIGERDAQTSLYKIGFSNARWATGLATFNKKVLEGAFESGYVKAKSQEEGIEIPKDSSKHIVEENIETISPKTLLSQYDLQKIDLLMMDTEGFDFEVIKMFDIATSKPNMIIFEHHHFDTDKNNEIKAYLNNHDYQTIQIGSNTVAIKQEHLHRIKV